MSVALLLQLLEIIPVITKAAGSIKKELQRTGEMTEEETAAVNARWNEAFASPHWQPEEE